MAEITRKELILLLAAVPDRACGKNEKLIRLAGVDLSGLDLSGLNLSHADFAGANLRGCDLSDACLRHCDFSRADLTGAILRGVHGEQAIFMDAALPGADFRASERDVFYGTHLAGANFQGADLTDAVLAGASLEGADFEDAVLIRANLTECGIDDCTNFERARMAECVFDDPAAGVLDRDTDSMPLFPALQKRSRRVGAAGRCDAA
ncbi:MAG TPA: pentapeptide repeat-containing protein [Tepidisphaeraceae bacterium]|nr:pentapeptide repeat-containing protein [Tepidisphaeraceae bacterium]